MHFGIFSSLFGALLAVHTLLYHPTFAPLPESLYAPLDTNPLILSEKKSEWKPAPTIQALGAIVVDQKSAEILFAQNSDKVLAPASTTKIMTALLVIENYDLNQIASVSSGLARDGSSMGLVTGESIRVRDLLSGLLITSANDAADELSRLYPGGTSAFVKAMNWRAGQLGLVHTHYDNSIGYADPTHVTTVRDLAILAKEAMSHPEFSEPVKMQSLVVSSVDGKIKHNLKTTNVLLGTFQGMEGIKTGWTQEAGECLVAQATRGDQTYIVVVLNSPDRFGEAKRLLNWAFDNYKTNSVSLD